MRNRAHITSTGIYQFLFHCRYRDPYSLLTAMSSERQKMKPQNRRDRVGTMRFCPVCSYYLYLQDGDKTPATVKEKQPWMTLKLQCRHCGYSETMAPKTSEEALILETSFGGDGSTKQTVSALNAYTRLDPTLPHLKTIACPNAACASQADPESRDILYIKTDPRNMKYQYACTVCNTQWGS